MDQAETRLRFAFGFCVLALLAACFFGDKVEDARQDIISGLIGLAGVFVGWAFGKSQ